MRKYLIVMVATMCLGISSATAVRAQNVGWSAERKQLKAQQKLEFNALKVQQRNRKQSWNRQRVTSAERAQANHQMKRERRNLKQRQKDALQDLKDRQKAVSDMNRAYGR
jgi:biopolymer transport protein ExbB/TolQ